MKMQRKLSIALFVLYIILLVWIIVFKCEINIVELTRLRSSMRRSINLIPFSSLMITNGKINMSEIIENVLIFVPLGVFINMFKPKWYFIQKVAVCFGVSLLFEILQFVFAIGGSDITDIINNTLGGIIGIGIYALLYRLLKDKADKVINIIALITVVLLFLFMGVLIISNM